MVATVAAVRAAIFAIFDERICRSPDFEFAAPWRRLDTKNCWDSVSSTIEFPLRAVRSKACVIIVLHLCGSAASAGSQAGSSCRKFGQNATVAGCEPADDVQRHLLRVRRIEGVARPIGGEPAGGVAAGDAFAYAWCRAGEQEIPSDAVA
jgi:hypothetical protein